MVKDLHNVWTLLRTLIFNRKKTLSRMKEIEQNWWPDELIEFSTLDLSKGSTVRVAEISEPFGKDSGFQLYSALVSKDQAAELFNSPFSIGFPIGTSGPHPTSIPSGKPWFKFNAGESEIEPLVVSWEAGGFRVLLPDQGFLMTYGLVPRVLQSEHADQVVWDDLAIPEFDIVRSEAKSIYHYKLTKYGFVEVDRTYLQDYSTSRDMVMIQIYYLHCQIEPTEAITSLLGDSQSTETNNNGRWITLRKDIQGSEYECEVWGIHEICSPGPSPIIGDYFTVQPLTWPGIDEPIDDSNYMDHSNDWVYVRDSVLGRYEEHSNLYTVHPDSGGVSYRNIWSVGYSQRMGRDLIALELKKLYEGNIAKVINHWHGHAVEPPSRPMSELRQELNVAVRSIEIIEQILTLGKLLTRFGEKSLGRTVSPTEVFSYDEKDLRYRGFWVNPYLRRIAKHISPNIGRETFFYRCIDLENATAESLKENYLRELLISMGIDRAELTKLKRLKLLNVLIAYCQISQESGLHMFDEFGELDSRRKMSYPSLSEPPHLITPVKSLFMLHDLRIGAAHRGDRLDELVNKYSIDKASLESGWGFLLDSVYDEVIEALAEVNRILERSL